MNILIVNPPYDSPIIREGRCQSPQNMRKTAIPQMTLAYLATVLVREGHSVSVFDCIADNISTNGLFDKLIGSEPDLALVNTVTPSIMADLGFVEALKKHLPNCFSVVFGTHVTALHKEIIMENLFVDCVIRNEPEWTAVDLAAALQSNSISEAGIPGCTFRFNGNIVISQERVYNENLDSLGFPAWEYFDHSKYIHPIFNQPYLTVNTSRGCVHSCIFCVASVFYGKKVRYRSIQSIVDELENHVIARYGIRHIWMYADDFTRSPEYVKKLCKAIIQRKLKITWWTNTRVDKPDKEMFKLMKAAGCFMLSIGGESGNNEILRNIKKGTKIENIKETVNILHKVGINSLVYFLIGLPGETRETIQETLDFSKRLNPDYVEFYPATPYPGTEFYDIAMAENLVVDSDWENYMCGGDQFVVEIPGVNKTELEEILRKAYREFYVRPSYAWVLFKRMLHPAEFFRLMSFGFGYFKRFLVPGD